MTREELRNNIEKEYFDLCKKYENTKDKEYFYKVQQLYERAKFLRYDIVRNWNDDGTLNYCIVTDVN